jgi:hypothetical protein
MQEEKFGMNIYITTILESARADSDNSDGSDGMG